MKTKISADFQICISVPSNIYIKKKIWLSFFLFAIVLSINFLLLFYKFQFLHSL